MKQKTKPLTQLYHQFLKPKGIPEDKLPLLVATLYEARFIDVIQAVDLITERYVELPKLLNQTNKNELFKIIGGLK